jgi:hypothetical protein
MVLDKVGVMDGLVILTVLWNGIYSIKGIGFTFLF